MTTDLSLFKTAFADSPAFKSLMETNDKLIGGGGEYRRISIKGSKFRQILNGEQVFVSNEQAMNIIVVDTAPIARTYFAGSYDPNGDPVPPTCWSHNTETPAPDVESPQAARCGDCPQNIKGSGQGNSRACRFSQRMAVAIEGDIEKIYQFQIPATSIFGEAKENALPMQGYARLLKEHKLPISAVVTQMRFDQDAEVPKLYFSPIRPLASDELEQVVKMRDSEAVRHALDMTVSQTDHVPEAKQIETKPDDKKVAELFPETKKEEVVAEPTKMQRQSNAAPQAAADNDLSAIVGEWDDDA
jgi:hypothetical protein